MNVVDSLAAIKKLVFEDNQLELRELVKALDANWNGFEEMRNVPVGAQIRK